MYCTCMNKAACIAYLTPAVLHPPAHPFHPLLIVIRIAVIDVDSLEFTKIMLWVPPQELLDLLEYVASVNQRIAALHFVAHPSL